MRDLNARSFGKGKLDQDLAALQRAASLSFDEWADQILRRIGQVVNSREPSQRRDQGLSSVARPSYRPHGDRPAIFKYPPIKTTLDQQLSEQHRPVVLQPVITLTFADRPY